MAGIVAPNVARFALNGTFADQPIATVIDIIPVIVTGAGPSRPDFLSSTAPQLMSAFGSLLVPFSSLVSYTDITYVDLNSATGQVGSYTPPEPFTGLDDGNPLPGSCPTRINKNSTTFQRGQRAGRMYIPGTLESWTGTAGPNVLQANVVDAIQTAADQFFDELSEPIDPGTGDTFAPNMVVVHTKRPSPLAPPVFTAYSVVTSLGVQARIASQRRRLTVS